MQLSKSVGVLSTTVYDTLLRARGQEVGCHSLNHLIAVEEHGCYQGLLGAGQAGGNTQNSPLMGLLREKGGQHPILKVYYFHIS